MDKSDVDMEDAEKKAQDMEIKVETQSDAVDSNLKPEGTKLNCFEGRESNKSLVKCEYGVKPGTEDQSDSRGEYLGNVSSEAEDRKNGISGTEDQLNSKSQLEARGDVVGHDKNTSNIESQGQNNAKGDAHENATGGAEAQNQNKNENIGGELEGDVLLQKKEPATDVAKDDTRSDNVSLPDNEVHEIFKGEVDEVHQSEKMIFEVNQNGNNMKVDEQKDPRIKTNPATVLTKGDARSDVLPKAITEVSDTATEKMPEPATPKFLWKHSTTAKAGQHSGEASKNISEEAKMADDEDECEDDYEDGDDDGSPEDQAAFMRELESFYRERAMEFKPIKFYGHPLNFLKLWRSVIRLGGYDLVTGSKLWRQVGESFNPPKTCTAISWTFRNFYEKALLAYERHKKQSGGVQLPSAPPPHYQGVDNERNGHQASASGRARRDAAARAMQGWHEHHNLGYGEDKNANNMPKLEKNLKSIGSLKHKRQNEVEHPVKAARTETSKQLVTTVVDVGPPADWVKVNIRETRDCFEIYALVPGFLREEVRVQTDASGRVVISGQPEQFDNPWGVTAFKKDVRLPGRINPLQTSAVVSLHGRLYVRLPFAQ